VCVVGEAGQKYRARITKKMGARAKQRTKGARAQAVEVAIYLLRARK
jgi:hypothetical protein